MPDSELAERIVKHVRHPNYKPVKPRVIAKQLRLNEDEAKQMKREIKRLVKSGKLVYGAGHLVMPPAVSRNEIVGKFRRAQSGYGFVRPEGTSADRGREDDVFVPERKTLDAASGDLVRVRTRKRRDGDGNLKTAGAVIEILQRATKQFVGTYSERADVGLVQIDGTEFTMPILVGDPGAKGVHVGDKVVVEMVKYPRGDRPGHGVITEVLGERGAPGVDTLTIMREFDLPDRFSEEVMQDAREVADRFDGVVGDGRRDLTDLCVVTIDPKDARDFDDAISLEPLENGHWRLGVHIADVSHFVQPGSILDQEAADRATSVYLPDRVIPMLPEVISNHLASLQPNEVRFVQTAFIEYTADGVRVATDFCTGAIRSRHRFTYEEVDSFLEDRVPWSRKLEPDVFRLVDHMHRLAMKLRKRRLENGSLEMSMPEVKIDLDRDGRVCGAHRVENTESHQVIEEFMLAANEAVAERFRDEGVAFLSRIHGMPDLTKLQRLTDFVRELGIECESLESRFEIKRVLATVEGTPFEPAVNYAILRAMQKAVYSPEDVGHYALAMRNYCHFTSPIRRYPDLTIHRLMAKLFRGESTSANQAKLLTLGEHCSDREQRAESAERELKKLKLLLFLSERIGETLDVTVTGVEEFGLFAQGIELPAEGLLHVASLPEDHYYFDKQTHTLMGHRETNTFRLGDLLRVEIAEVDLQRRELDFTFRERIAPGEAPVSPFRSSPGTPGKDGRGDKRRAASTSARGNRRTKPNGKGRGRDAKRKKRRR